MTDRATLTITPYADRDDARHLVLDCPHGRSQAVVISDTGKAPPLTQIATMMIITLTLEEDCTCCESLYARYGGAFARPRGLVLPKFSELRAGVVAWLAAKDRDV